MVVTSPSIRRAGFHRRGCCFPVLIGLFLAAAVLAPLPCAAGILRAGDALEIFVADHPELTRKVLVSAEGTLDYPFFSDRSVLGLTPEEVSDLLMFRLAKSITNPFVLVTPLRSLPITVRVLGQVKKPGQIQLPVGSSMQEVLMAAEGPTDFANLADVRLIRDKATEADAVRVDFRKFMETGNISLLPEIRNNDTVILLASPRDMKVKVLGCVSRPGYYSLQGETTIFDAIYMAGGPEDKANLSKIRHVLQTLDGKNVDQIVDLQKYIDKGRMDEIPKVNAGDAIIVYKKMFTWGTFLTLVRDALMLFTAYQVFVGS